MLSKAKTTLIRSAACLGAIGAVAMSATLAFHGPAQAEFDAESHFSGQTITIVVASGAGSSTDLNARQIASILGQNVPGNPNVVVSNMPGGGGVTGLNNFYNTSEPDGLTLFFQGGTAYRQILADFVGAEHDLNEMTALGGIGGGAVAYGSASRISGVADLYQNEGDNLFVGLRGLSSAPTFDMLARLAALETTFTGVQYPGGAAEARLAIFRGEADVFSENEPAFTQQIQPEIDAGSVVPLWQTGLLIDGELMRDPQTPDVPTFEEVYADLGAPELTGMLAEAMEILNLTNTVFFSLYTAPGTPDDIADVLGEAVWTTLNDPAFLDETMVNGAPSHVVDAATATDANRRIVAMSDELKAAYLEWWQAAGLDL
jgi:tripartite-type tricarboxylate transporter receptor subunit TctC